MITTDATAMLLLAILLGVALIGAGCLAAFLLLVARRRRRPPADQPASPPAPSPPPTGVVLRAASTAPRQPRPARPNSGTSPRALLVTERITAQQLLTGKIDQATYRARMRELAMRAEAASQR